MLRSEHRILTTHVGSLIRPAALMEAGDDPAGHEARLRQAVIDVVKQQAEAGIDIVSDGEFGKSGWSNYILQRITGFEIRPDQCVP